MDCNQDDAPATFSFEVNASRSPDSGNSVAIKFNHQICNLDLVGPCPNLRIAMSLSAPLVGQHWSHNGRAEADSSPSINRGVVPQLLAIVQSRIRLFPSQFLGKLQTPKHVFVLKTYQIGFASAERPKGLRKYREVLDRIALTAIHQNDDVKNGGVVPQVWVVHLRCIVFHGTG